MPSATLLGQALISGVLAGGMYGLLALGLSLSWGLLRLVNLSHFALAFLAAYLTYELGTTYHVAPWWSAMLVVPALFAIGLVQHWLFDRFKVNELASLLITFSFAVVLALLGALLYGLKRLQSGSLLGIPARRIRILESASVAPRQKLMLVRVKDQDLLLGVTVQQISTLASFPVTDDEQAQDAAPVELQGNNHLAPMAHKLAELLKSVQRGDKSPGGTPGNNSSTDKG